MKLNEFYANKSTASRELGKLGIAREERAELIKGEVAPFTIDQKALNKKLRAAKAAEKAAKPVKATVAAPKAKVEPKAPAKPFVEPEAPNMAELAPVLAKLGATKPKSAPALLKEEVKQAAEKAVEKANAEPAPVVEAVEVTRVTKRQRVRQNGKTRPEKGVCCAIWNELDQFYADLGQVPTPAQVQELGRANNWHKVTCYRQANDWKRFHGFIK